MDHLRQFRANSTSWVLLPCERIALAGGLAIAENPALCHALAFLTVLLEVGYPLGLIAGLTTHRKIRFLALCIPWGMAGAVIGFNVILGRTFYELVAAHVFWLVAPKACRGRVTCTSLSVSF